MPGLARVPGLEMPGLARTHCKLKTKTKLKSKAAQRTVKQNTNVNEVCRCQKITRNVIFKRHTVHKISVSSYSRRKNTMSLFELNRLTLTKK